LLTVLVETNSRWNELQASDAQLLGRKTYEGFAAAWPTMEGTGPTARRPGGGARAKFL